MQCQIERILIVMNQRSDPSSRLPIVNGPFVSAGRTHFMFSGFVCNPTWLLLHFATTY